MRDINVCMSKIIEAVEIKDHIVLADQIWTPLQGFNAITSYNGGGKTMLLQLYI